MDTAIGHIRRSGILRIFGATTMVSCDANNAAPVLGTDLLQVLARTSLAERGRKTCSLSNFPLFLLDFIVQAAAGRGGTYSGTLCSRLN